jgi:hypothetical protein
MLKEQILDLLEKDREFRYAVAGLRNAGDTAEARQTRGNAAEDA